MERSILARASGTLALALLILAPAASSAAVAAPAWHASTIAVVGANKTNNWGGYNQGAVEKGTLFTSVGGDWIVPTATQHAKNSAEASSTWIGIGGGCPESNCVAPSATLIQEGTEQDVSKRGRASYSAWWELIPAPSVTITSLKVHPGDHMRGSIAEAIPGSNLWTMTLRNLTTGRSWSQTVPYSSGHDTAEWIEETPLSLGGGGGAGLSSMPDLTRVRFNRATVNGSPARLRAPEEIQLVDGNNRPVATPSRPDAQHDGFNVCTYASSCPAPAG